MSQIALRCCIALLTFFIGVSCVISYTAFSSYKANVRRGRETVLRQNLYRMRKSIDLYSADRGALPESLNDLVSSGFLQEVPKDPITGQRNWVTEIAHDPNSSERAEGIADIHSASSAVSSEGSPYDKW
jgi:general secretion pathway protein G